MKKNIYNDEETFLKWTEQLNTSKRVPRYYRHMLNQKLAAYFPKPAAKKPLYRRTSFKWAMGTVCAAVLCLCFPSTIRASITDYFTGVFISNKEIDAIADTDSHIGVVVDEPAILETNPPVINSHVADAASFSKNIPYNSISDVILSKSDDGFNIPDFLFNSGDIAVFTQDASNGWSLKKGDVLTVTLETAPYFSGANGDGETILFGYILDRKFYEIDTQSNAEVTFTLTAPKDGIYYPCVENFAISYIKVLSGQVTVN